jgi:hypothetical protein
MLIAALQPEGKGTRLIQRMERLTGPLWIRLAQPGLVWPLYGRRAVGKGLANIKAKLEAMKAESLTNYEGDHSAHLRDTF